VKQWRTNSGAWRCARWRILTPGGESVAGYFRKIIEENPALLNERSNEARLADRRVWPAIDIARSGTRREELLLDEEDLRRISLLRKALSDRQPTDAMEQLTRQLRRSVSNAAFLRSLPG
jgi:hypothetical protein